jgi:hypothetical protein
LTETRQTAPIIGKADCFLARTLAIAFDQIAGGPLPAGDAMGHFNISAAGSGATFPLDLRPIDLWDRAFSAAENGNPRLRNGEKTVEKRANF